MKKIIVIIVLAAVFLLEIVQDHVSASINLQVQGLESVVLAQLIPAHGMTGATAITLNVTNEQEREVIFKVLGWLNSSKVVGDAKDQFSPKGGDPTCFTIRFLSGENIRIIDAVGAVSRKLENGSIERRSVTIANEVTIEQGGKAWRIIAPELKSWIQGGWKQEAFNQEQNIGELANSESSCTEPPITLDWVGKKYDLKIIDTARSLEPNTKLGFLRCANGEYYVIPDDGVQDVITIQDAPTTADKKDIILMTKWGRLLYAPE